MVCPICLKTFDWSHFVNEDGQDCRKCVNCEEEFTDDYWIGFNMGFEQGQRE